MASFWDQVLSSIHNLTTPAVYSYDFTGPQPINSKLASPVKTTQFSQNLPKSQVAGANVQPAAPAPAPQSNQPYRFAFENFKPSAGYTPPVPQQPPTDIAQIIRQLFPKEATAAALVASTENGAYNPRVKDNINSNGRGIDRGIFQINDQTFNGLLQRRAAEMQNQGINNFDQMYDPSLNAKVAKMIYDEGGWGRWYGWQNKGYDLLNGYFTAPSRQKGQ